MPQGSLGAGTAPLEQGVARGAEKPHVANLQILWRAQSVKLLCCYWLGVVAVFGSEAVLGGVSFWRTSGDHPESLRISFSSQLLIQLILLWRLQ
jgi:hypothetical protein